jgi:hypothetical protein
MSRTATRSARIRRGHAAGASGSAEGGGGAGRAGRAAPDPSQDSGRSPRARLVRVGALTLLVALLVGVGTLALAGELHVSIGTQRPAAMVPLARVLHPVAPGGVAGQSPAPGAPSVKVQMRALGTSGAFGSITLARSGTAHFSLRTAVVVPRGGFVARLSKRGRPSRELSRSSGGGALIHFEILSAKQLRSYQTIDVARTAAQPGRFRNGRTLLRIDIGRAMAPFAKR